MRTNNQRDPGTYSSNKKGKARERPEIAPTFTNSRTAGETALKGGGGGALPGEVAGRPGSCEPKLCRGRRAPWADWDCDARMGLDATQVRDGDVLRGGEPNSTAPAPACITLIERKEDKPRGGPNAKEELEWRAACAVAAAPAESVSDDNTGIVPAVPLGVDSWSR